MNYLKIFNEINNTNSFLICHSSNFRELVKLKSSYELSEKTLYQFKIITIDELINFLSFSETDELYLRMLEKGISKSVSQEIFKFAKYNFNNINLSLNKYLIDNKEYLDFHDAFKTSLKDYQFYSLENIVLLKPFIDKYQLNFKGLEIKSENTPLVYKFKTLEEEVIYLFNEIAKLLDEGIKPSKIYITGLNDNYNNTVLKMSKLFNINVSLKNGETLKDIPYIKVLLANDYDNLINLLKDISNLNELYRDYRLLDKNSFDKNINKIINILNKYPLNKYDKRITYQLIKDDINNTKSYQKAVTNAVNVISLEEIITTKSDDFVFVINASYESFPKLLNDNEYLTDKEKTIINYPDTTLINTTNNNHLKQLVSLQQIRYISFAKRDNYNEYQASDLLATFNIINQELVFDNQKVIYAKNVYKDFFASEDDLGTLLTTFTGNFNLSKEEQALMSNYLKNLNFKLSPSSVARYFQVPFIYYLERVLKISNFKPRVSTLIGNFFHQMAEILMLLEFEEKVKRNESFHKDTKINKLINNFVILADKNQVSIEELFDNYLDLYILEIINNEETILIKETKFFISKNKSLLLGALSKLISLENFYNSKIINLEMAVGNNELRGNSDLVKIHPDNSFTIIDYKSNAKKAFNYETISNAVDSLIKEENLSDLADLDLLQLVIYGMLLNLEYKDLTLNNLGYFGYFTNDHRINALQTNDLDQTYYQGGNKTVRMMNDEQQKDLYQRLNLLIKETRDKIVNAKFPISVLKQLDNKKNLEKEWFSTYQALAFFNRNDSENSEEENVDEE